MGVTSHPNQQILGYCCYVWVATDRAPLSAHVSEGDKQSHKGIRSLRAAGPSDERRRPQGSSVTRPRKSAYRSPEWSDKQFVTDCALVSNYSHLVTNHILKEAQGRDWVIGGAGFLMDEACDLWFPVQKSSTSVRQRSAHRWHPTRDTTGYAKNGGNLNQLRNPLQA